MMPRHLLTAAVLTGLVPLNRCKRPFELGVLKNLEAKMTPKKEPKVKRQE